MIVFRYWGGEANEIGSPWFSITSDYSPEEARKYLALPDQNSARNISAFKISAGTTILEGEVASQVCVPGFGEYAIGGGTQIYIPNPDDAILIPY